MDLFCGSLRAKLLFLLLILGMALIPIFLSSNHVLAAQVTLGWDANLEPDIAGYKVHYGTSTLNYSTHIDVGKATTYTVTNLQSLAYYFAVTAYNTSGQESGYSAEAVYNPPSCSYSISASSQSFPASGGTGSVTVTTSAGCTWTVINNASSWITVTSNSSATGNGTVNYSAAANTGTTSRTGTLIIGGKTFTVTQSAGTATCTYSVSPTSQPFNSSGGTGTINMTAPRGCSWTASKNVSWITINTGSSGSGNGTTSYSVSANTASTSRTGTITIAGKTLTVTQSGGTATCTYSISPTSQSFGLSGGTGTVSVTATSGCTWTASSSVTWMAITSGSSGSANGTTAYSVAANSDTSPRTGTLTIAGKTFTVTQTGSLNYTLTASAGSGGKISPSGRVIVASGGSQIFTITPKSGYQISSVLVDGKSVGAVGSYTFSNVTANHTISASFTSSSGSWTFCANEGQQCNFSGTREVRYGANGVYVTKTLTNGTACTNSVFGDPLRGVVKQCYTRPAATLTVTASAGSGGTISPFGSVQIASGGSRTFTITPNSGYHLSSVLVDGRSIEAVGSYTFSNVTANHTLSASFTSSSASWTFCANEWEQCNFSGTKQVRYGADGVYIIKTLTNGTPCTNSIFGDPLHGVLKQCYIGP